MEENQKHSTQRRKRKQSRKETNPRMKGNTPETKRSGSGSKEATEERAQTRNRTPSRLGGERTEEGAGRRQKANKKSEGKETEEYRKRNLNLSQNHSRKAEEGEIKGEEKGELKVTTGQRSTARNTEQQGGKAEPRQLAGEGEQGRTMRTPTPTHARNARTKE